MNDPAPVRRKHFMQERSMLTRIAVGLLAAAGYISLVFTANGLPFALAVALLSVIGAKELYTAVKNQGGEPNEFMGLSACIVFHLVAWTHYGQRFAPYLPAVLLVLVISTLLAELGKRRPKPIVTIGTTLIGAVYAGWLLSYLTLLHGMQPGMIRLNGENVALLVPPIANTTPGEWLVIFVSACTWMSDTGALFVGKALGKHKLAPNISPGKTWEGSIGGVATSLLTGAGLGIWLHLPLIHALGLAAMCAVFGQIGDLCESALKRDLGVKDFGSVMPGHGGILDRIDSLLFSAPLAYYYVLFFLMRAH
jgi:phosphatidate cytidylyltransferase